MYVCLCNGLTDRQVRGAASGGGCSPKGVYRALGVRPQCGKCIPLMREIIRDHADGSSGAVIEGMPVPA